MRANTSTLEVCTADYCSRTNKLPGYIQERLLYVKRARAKGKAEDITAPALAAKKKILKKKIEQI